MSRFFTGLLIVASGMAAIYAIAAAIATNLTPTFATAETTRPTRIVEFASAMKRAATEHRTARAKCELLSDAEKSICDADAAVEQKRAKAEARVIYKGGVPLPAKAEARGSLIAAMVFGVLMFLLGLFAALTAFGAIVEQVKAKLAV